MMNDTKDNSSEDDDDSDNITETENDSETTETEKEEEDECTVSYIEFEQNLKSVMIGKKLIYIHDNGGRSFQIRFSKDNIMTVIENDNDTNTFHKVVFKSKVIRFWKGFDSIEGMHGCACLAETDLHTYVHIYRSTHW